MATTYTDPSAWLFYGGQARTDESGNAADDMTGEDIRAILDVFSEGVVSGLAVSERGAGANSSVDVEVGGAFLKGSETDQGTYYAKIAGASAVNVTIGAADPSNPRIDEVYLVVQDSGYDSSANVVPRIAVRDGTPASSPSAPGPDSDWTAYLLLASVAVAANETEIEDEHITDERDFTELSVAAGGSVPTGMLSPFAGSTAPDGYLLCNGAAVSRTTFARLFTVIGETFGAGDSSTTFNVPDMRGAYPRGVAASGTGDALGDEFGSDLIVDHTHPVNPPVTNTSEVVELGSTGDPGIDDFDGVQARHRHTVDIASFDSGAVTGTNPEQLPASVAVNYIIKT